ncbi:MAG TPA: hypothetical protein VMP01_28575 [Pirellulaceae bacterium]|nr:hypothetical protein [Pirellulaceae bacterium]
MSAINPYQPPIEENPAVLSISAVKTTAQEVFLAWEKLRLAYNIVLVLVTLGGLGIVGTEFVNWRQLAVTLAIDAIVANLCFCAGPCLEGYLAWIGAERRITRTIVFVLGTILASLLALVEVYRLTGQPF